MAPSQTSVLTVTTPGMDRPTTPILEGEHRGLLDTMPVYNLVHHVL